jgi:hypothetical protein
LSRRRTTLLSTSFRIGSASVWAAIMACMRVMCRNGFPSTMFVLFRIAAVCVTVFNWMAIGTSQRNKKPLVMSRQLPQTPLHCPTASYLTNQLIIEECVYLLDMGSWSIYKYIMY